ncbi:MAG: Rieske (2Fe-2S) protein [Marmoricola sp.]
MTENEATRRNVLVGVAAVGVAVPVLAACGSSGSSDGPGDTSGNGAPSTPDGGETSGGSTIKASDIPVGGGKIYPDQQVVVTQPTKGDFKAFSAVCTHQGCIVNQVEDKQIKCPCHFSHYSIADGHVESGPAPKPLPEKTVKVSGDSLIVS